MNHPAWKMTPRRQGGLTLIELLIALLLMGVVSTAAFQYYKSQNEAYLSQAATADRQSNVRSAMVELSRQVRHAGYLVPGGDVMRSSAQYDTLEIYVGRAGGANVDTIRYFVQGAAGKGILAKQVGQAAPQVFAENIDTALFVPVGPPPVHSLAIALVSSVTTQFQGSALSASRRLGSTVSLRNR